MWGNPSLLHSHKAYKHFSVWLIHHLDHEKHKRRPRCLPLVLWWQSKRVLKGRVALASVSTAGAVTKAQFCILVPLPSAICKLRRVTVMLNMLSGSNKGSRGVPLLQRAGCTCAVYPSDREIYHTRRQKQYECCNVPTLESKPRVLARQTCKKIISK